MSVTAFGAKGRSCDDKVQFKIQNATFCMFLHFFKSIKAKAKSNYFYNNIITAISIICTGKLYSHYPRLQSENKKLIVDYHIFF